jgi:hypothetical protein
MWSITCAAADAERAMMSALKKFLNMAISFVVGAAANELF